MSKGPSGFAISGLPQAVLPLTGEEVFALVQGGLTVQAQAVAGGTVIGASGPQLYGAPVANVWTWRAPVPALVVLNFVLSSDGGGGANSGAGFWAEWTEFGVLQSEAVVEVDGTVAQVERGQLVICVDAARTVQISLNSAFGFLGAQIKGAAAGLRLI
jgi:hypothetical protein